MFQLDLRYTHFPYCLEQQADGLYVVLNRKYTPIGFISGEAVALESLPARARLNGLTAKVATRLSFEGRSALDMIFLYGDGCVPTSSAKHMTSYLDRLGVLMKLKISMTKPRSRRAPKAKPSIVESGKAGSQIRLE